MSKADIEIHFFFAIYFFISIVLMCEILNKIYGKPQFTFFTIHFFLFPFFKIFYFSVGNSHFFPSNLFINFNSEFYRIIILFDVISQTVSYYWHLKK